MVNGPTPTFDQAYAQLRQYSIDKRSSLLRNEDDDGGIGNLTSRYRGIKQLAGIAESEALACAEERLGSAVGHETVGRTL